MKINPATYQIHNVINSIPLRRKKIILGLIAAIGIELLVLGIIYREPLVTRYFDYRQKTHIVSTFNTQKVRIIQHNDTIVDQTNPDQQVTLTLNPGGFITNITSDQNGQWRYQIPASFSEGRYTLLIADGSQTKELKVRIVSNRVFYRYFGEQ